MPMFKNILTEFSIDLERKGIILKLFSTVIGKTQLKINKATNKSVTCTVTNCERQKCEISRRVYLVFVFYFLTSKKSLY